MECATMNPSPIKSAASATATAMFFSESSFSMSSFGVIQSNRFKPPISEKMPKAPNAAADQMDSSREAGCQCGVTVGSTLVRGISISGLAKDDEVSEIHDIPGGRDGSLAVLIR